MKHNTVPLDTLASRIGHQSGPEALSPEQMILVFKALTAEIGRLDRPACNRLLASILDIKWTKEKSDFQNAYARFLCVLVSGIPRWWSQTAKKMISEFTRENTEIHHSVLKFILGLMPTSTTSLPDIFKNNYPHKSDPTKLILRYISNLLSVVEYAPEVRSNVWALIMEKTVELDVELQDEFDDDEDEMDDNQDDDGDDEDDDTVKETVPGVTASLVQINAMAGDAGNDSDDDDEADDNDSEISEYDVEDIAMSASAVRTKLDSVMSLLLNYLDNCFSVSEIESGDGQSLFVTLQHLFKTYILSTYRTRSVQYLLFWASHANPLLMDAFLASLLETALSPRENMERKLKAMQYISSFIARAKGLSRMQIVFVISILTSWLDRYVEEREAEVDTQPGGMGRFRLFYSATQTIMYIFCFRHAMLRKEISNSGAVGSDEQSQLQSDETGNDATSKIKSSSDSEWECDLDKLFRRLIITKFNPLRYCRRTVVAMFAQIARKEDLVYCFTIMEQNRLGKSATINNSNNNNNSGPRAGPTGVGGGVLKSSSSVPAVANSSSSNQVTSSSLNNSGTTVGDVFWQRTSDFVMLDAYFPFDPLHLPQCRQRMQTLYLEWADVADDSESSGSDDYDEDDGDEEVDDEIVE